ncbi:uncharacterized protein [Populus alba]|uniref:uncharacterized protein isoform X1 n=1 Tax=Populus alba TaxID=43335 RepID=UPI00158DD25B|nr:uncharacterized protein LOC118032925 isoform X1 [Populus alba]
MPASHTPHFDRVHFSASSSDISLSGEIGAHRNSSVSDCLSEVDLESGALDMEVHLDNKTQRDCRICHLDLETSEQECGGAIELGCSCKGDLGAAHKKCAETWFKIKGNTQENFDCSNMKFSLGRFSKHQECLLSISWGFLSCYGGSAHCQRCCRFSFTERSVFFQHVAFVVCKKGLYIRATNLSFLQ